MRVIKSYKLSSLTKQFSPELNCSPTCSLLIKFNPGDNVFKKLPWREAIKNMFSEYSLLESKPVDKTLKSTFTSILGVHKNKKDVDRMNRSGDPKTYYGTTKSGS